MHAARHLLHCAILGAALFAAERMREPAVAAPIDAAGGPRDEALLARAAREAGLGRGDAFVAETLARRVGFLAAPDASPDERRAEALALGMAERDPAVRARLASLLESRIRNEAARAAVDQDVLEAWFDANRARWRRPATVEVAHVFFGGAAQRERAVAALARIEREAIAPDAAPQLGDPNLFGAALAPSDESGLAARLGAPFSQAAFAAPLGAWVGPIASSHGTHLVLVLARTPARDASLSEVRPAVWAAWRTAQADAALEAALAKLRAAARDASG